jgi:hypothetical protein
MGDHNSRSRHIMSEGAKSVIERNAVPEGPFRGDAMDRRS